MVFRAKSRWNVVECGLLCLLSAHATQDGFNTEHEFLHREGLGDVVVGTELESLYDILFLGLCREEDDGHLGIGLADFGGQGEAVLLWHHHIKHADVVLGLHEGLVACLTIGTELGGVAFGLQILAKQHAEVLVVFAQ